MGGQPTIFYFEVIQAKCRSKFDSWKTNTAVCYFIIKQKIHKMSILRTVNSVIAREIFPRTCVYKCTVI